MDTHSARKCSGRVSVLAPCSSSFASSGLHRALHGGPEVGWSLICATNVVSWAVRPWGCSRFVVGSESMLVRGSHCSGRRKEPPPPRG